MYDLVEQNADESKLSWGESQRRRNIQNTQVYAYLNINGQRVGKTKKVRLTYPELTADLAEMFQVHVFTMPSSIKVELMMSGILSDTEIEQCDIEVPGQHVKTLTCASSLIQKLSFSQALVKIKGLKGDN